MNLEDRIKQQFPGLSITLLSVLVGLIFSDLLEEARVRMPLWPLDLATLRTWAQIAGNGVSIFVSWIVFAHVGISRLRIPSLADSLVLIATPTILAVGTSFVGQKEAWPWFYWASFFLLVGILSWHWQVRITREEPELASFSRLARPLGPLAVLYGGVPCYFAAGWADSHGYLSPMGEMLMAAASGPLAMVTAILFFRDWHRAIDEAKA
jgi:hypothetical protein